MDSAEGEVGSAEAGCSCDSEPYGSDVVGWTGAALCDAIVSEVVADGTGTVGSGG